MLAGMLNNFIPFLFVAIVMNPLQRGSKVATSFLRKTRSLQQLPLMKNITSISKLLLPNQSNQIVRQYSMYILMYFFNNSLSQMEDSKNNRKNKKQSKYFYKEIWIVAEFSLFYQIIYSIKRR